MLNISATNLFSNKRVLIYNSTFSYKFVLSFGVLLGGHSSLGNITTYSAAYGLRTQNFIINLNLTAIELVKLVSIVEGLGQERTIVYFINSILSFSVAFKSTFTRYNRHLFFPAHFSVKIENVFKKFGILVLTKEEKHKIRLKKFLKKRKRFLLNSGKALLRKIFISSKWSYGFVSNASSFFQFADNVQHEKVKFGKVIGTFREKVKSFLDFYPFLPHYGVIGDHKSNYWIVNEFKMAKVPNSSVIDNFTKNALKSMYGIPGNACSLDTTLFFLMLTIGSYLLGFTKNILKFIFIDSDSTIKKSLTLVNNYIIKSNFFFKKFVLIPTLLE